MDKGEVDFSVVHLPFSVSDMMQTAVQFLSLYKSFILLFLGVIFSAVLYEHILLMFRNFGSWFNENLSFEPNHGSRKDEGYTFFAAYNVRRDPEDPETIQRRINKALKSSDLDERFEGEVAKSLGSKVVAFDKKIDPPGKPRAGQIDIETDNYIIEVTRGASSKKAREFEKFFTPLFNPKEKGIILYAPHLRESKVKGIKSIGVIFVRDLDELLKLVGV